MAGIEEGGLVSCCENALRELGIQEPQIQTVDESYAALYYFFSKYQTQKINLSALGDGDRILMYDFGGGTTDLTLIQFNKQKRMYKVIDVGGDTTLGGDDVTREIVRIVTEEIKGEMEESVAERVKLSMDDDRKYSGEWPEKPQIERQKLIGKIKDFLRPRVTTILKDIGLQVGKPNDNLKLVVLAGGSSKLEGFEELIKELLPEVNVGQLSKPKLGVAMGAFMYSEQPINLLRLTSIPYRVLLALPSMAFGPIENIPVVLTENTSFATLIKKGEEYGEDGTITKTYNRSDLGISPGSGGSLSFYFQYGVGRPRLRYIHRINNPNTTKIIITLDKNKKIHVEEASFKITKQSLENLKSEGVPNDVLEKLQSLKNQEIIGEEKFLDILKGTIGDEQTVRFKSLILKHAIEEE
jgi:cell division ATPase FtsA